MLVTVSALADKAKAAIAESKRSIELFTIDETPGIPSLASIAIDAEPPAVSIDPANDIAVLPYSSGTTGLPKGVMLTHRNIVAQLKQIDAIESVEMPALLGVLPFFHIYGMVIIMMHGLMRGATIVTMPKFEFEPFLKVLSGLADYERAHRAADRRRARQAPAGRQLQVPAPEIHLLGRGAARSRVDARRSRSGSTSRSARATA